jgi:two-component system cell cycle sensor histidine kinase/response regulator CckA
MSGKPDYEDLEKRLKELEKKALWLRKEEERFRSLAEKTSDWIWEVDQNGLYTYSNPKVEDLLGYDPDEILGKTPFDFMPSEERTRAAGWFNEILESGEPFEGLENTCMSKDGQWVVMETSGVPLFDEAARLIGYRGIDRDITERKRAEEKLRDSEEKYRLLIEHIPSVTWITSEHGETTFISPNVEKIYGFSQKEIYEAEGLTLWIDRIHPDDIKRVRESFEKMFTTGQMFDLEYRIKRKDDKWIWLHDRAFRAFEKNNIKYASGVFSDITERKMSEQALKESEEKLSLFMNSATDSFTLLDSNLNLVDVNARLLETIGKKRRDVIGRNLREIISDVEKTVRYEKYLEVLRTGKPVGIEDSVYLPGVGVKHFFFKSFKVSDGIGIIATDITDIIQAREKLRESEEKFRMLFELAPDAYYLMDMEGTIIDANKTAQEIVEYKKEDLIGKSFFELGLLSSSSIPKATMLLKRNLEGESTGPDELILNRKNGLVVMIEIRMFPTKLKNKGVILGIARDISERKKLESQLTRAQRMESIGTLAGGVAHDFNNLLMGIQGRTSLMLNKMDPSHPHYQHLNGIENYVESAADLTKQLLGFARGGKYKVEDVNLNELLEGSSKMFGRTKKEINIHMKYQRDIWTVQVDRIQIEQVFLNLYVNAWQSMPGGGNLYLETENVILDDTSTKPFFVDPGRYVRVSVTDTGVGMDEKTQERVFEPFFTTKEMGRGTGLGLASAYGIIKNHDGLINVYSEKGEGTTFSIYLPASDKLALEKKDKLNEAIGGTEMILLVDDEDVPRDVAKEILEALGYRVLTAKSGNEAIEVYSEKAHEIDMVILDMIMPNMDGGETFERLKEIDPEARVLLSSGYSINGQAQEILSRGCKAFLQKPFNMTTLSQKMREVLDSK